MKCDLKSLRKEGAMKRAIQVFVLFIAAVWALSGAAFGAGTNTVTVSATVLGTCAFNAAASALAFGNLDPSLVTDASAATSVTFWCTKNAAYSVTDDDGLYETGINANRMISATVVPTEYIPYTMSYNPSAGTGAGFASPITLNISGTVLNADYIGASADTFSDTVTITVNP